MPTKSRDMRFDTKTICLIAIIVVLAGIILYLVMKKPDEGYSRDGAGSDRAPIPAGAVVNPASMQTPSPAAAGADASQVPALVLFHADWCPHCKHLLPVWDEVKKAVGSRALLIDIESKNPIMSHHKLPGFPTIRYFPKGLAANSDFLEYNGDRSTKSVLDFLSSCMAQAK